MLLKDCTRWDSPGHVLPPRALDALRNIRVDPTLPFTVPSLPLFNSRLGTTWKEKQQREKAPNMPGCIHIRTLRPFSPTSL